MFGTFGFKEFKVISDFGFRILDFHCGAVVEASFEIVLRSFKCSKQ
jgi:hypothetical protein